MPQKEKKTKESWLTKEIAMIILNNIADLVLIIEHKTHNWIYANPASKRMLGYTPEEMAKQNTITTSIIASHSKVIIKKNWPKLVQKGFLSNIQIIFINKKGKEIPISYSQGLLKNKKGEITHRIAILRDMGETNRLIREIDASKRKLGEKLQDVEKMNRLMIGRELQMADLKKQIAELKEKLGIEKTV